jgi:hypothetical protein
MTAVSPTTIPALTLPRSVLTLELVLPAKMVGGAGAEVSTTAARKAELTVEERDQRTASPSLDDAVRAYKREPFVHFLFPLSPTLFFPRAFDTTCSHRPHRLSSISMPVLTPPLDMQDDCTLSAREQQLASSSTWNFAAPKSLKPARPLHATYIYLVPPHVLHPSVPLVVLRNYTCGSSFPLLPSQVAMQTLRISYC